jgi:membrane-associated phospholipid phosphatase
VRHFLFAASISLVLTLGFFSLWPAIGPWTVEAFNPGKTQAQVGTYLLSLKSQAVPDGPELAGIVAFPSFHVVLAILATRALWGIAKLRPFCAALCLAICISTVATGWHYFVDVFAGIAVAAVSQMIASWALQTQPRPVLRAVCRNPGLTPGRAV